ncbi:Gam-like protein [Leptospira kirschneri str. 200801774]|uniref:host-nuclease inhibitor Gam family protein n=1 Tax=Leptospira kirschneri TaxID=29507 RepID=UPI0002BD3E2A|nr:host-nuclease inhibitor Gam family protein [Leptospira kirschneri]EMO80240.1 Gam-like protein [Leptospira kirschneri str. 200801774]
MSSTQPPKTLEDLNKRLQRLIEIESDLKRIDGDKNTEVESVRSRFIDTERELVFEKENLDKQVREYILNNKDIIFVHKKTVELPFATIKRIDSQEIEITDEKSKTLPPYTVDLVEKYYSDRAPNVIQIKKTIKKAALKNWTNAELKKVGATRFYNTNINYVLRMELPETDIARDSE